jgi:hypothetical protein
MCYQLKLGRSICLDKYRNEGTQAVTPMQGLRGGEAGVINQRMILDHLVGVIFRF